MRKDALGNDVNYNTATKIYNVVGGRPLEIYTANPLENSNTCAIRLSRALLYAHLNTNNSPIIIPNIPDQTFLGNDGKYYFLSAANMIEWMKLTFGTPQGNNSSDNLGAGKNGRNLPNKLFNKKGIYGLLALDTSKTTGFAASGHVDIFYDCTCNGKCHFNPRGGIKNVYLWELN